MFAQSLVEGAMLGGMVTWVAQRPAVIGDWVRNLDERAWMIAGVALLLMLVAWSRRSR